MTQNRDTREVNNHDPFSPALDLKDGTLTPSLPSNASTRDKANTSPTHIAPTNYR